MLLQIYHLVDEQKCYEEVRKIRWPNGVHCPHCDAKLVSKRGFHTHFFSWSLFRLGLALLEHLLNEALPIPVAFNFLEPKSVRY